MDNIRGKTIAITGAARGIGYATAIALLERGARVVIGDRDVALQESAVAQLTKLGPVSGYPLDVTDRESFATFLDKARTDGGGHIDVLINNAGVIQVGPVESVTIELLEEAMRSNFWSAAHATLFSLPHLRERRGEGRIVNIVSIGGRVAIPHMLSYDASKFALMGFSEALRAELLRAGIKVTTVIPGPMRTGSIYNAEFAGKPRREFEWFSLLASMPVFTIGAERAAARVIDAAEEGKDEIHLGLSSYVLSFLHGVAPRFVTRMMSLMNRALPAPGGAQGETWRGREIGTPLERSPLLRLSNRAARENNEAPPEQAR
jgi:NAD(P)-dependent dehydrogenase (short-subunit alcohol dehydrogenase family)